MKSLLSLLLVIMAIHTNSVLAQTMKLRIATFNVSMESLNYIERDKGAPIKVTGNELNEALLSNHPQIRNIAEIIQRINPDIILLNEFDRKNDSHIALKTFINDYLAKSQNNQTPALYPYFYQGPVNTGVVTPFDLNNDGKSAELPADAHGFGYFPGHFAMALLSKYPLDVNNIRTFQHFKWKDMPGALQPIDPTTEKPWYSAQAWQKLRLSSKSHWDIPVVVNEQTIHILASHPTPPVFDGPEDRNGKRNHDEIRFWHDYITPNKGDYIYDDNKSFGGLKAGNPFIILGDQNASNVDGDALSQGIDSLLTHPLIQDPNPLSIGAKKHSPDNIHGQHHTAYWRMRADYVLPSVKGFTLVNSGVFWPEENSEQFRLIKNREASSDHRLVWLDVELTHNTH